MKARTYWTGDTIMVSHGKGRKGGKRIKCRVYRLAVVTEDGPELELAKRSSANGIPAWMLRAVTAINNGKPDALAEVVKLKLGLVKEFNSNTAPFRRKPHTQEELPI